ncbi:hypothetical protein ACP70R_008597 [Stipagrostis hirtigluma subsp. patula]
MAYGCGDDYGDQIGANSRCQGAGNCTDDWTEDDGEIDLNKRSRGAGDCTDEDDDGRSGGQNKRCHVAAGSMGHNDEIGDGTGDHIDGGGDVCGWHVEETDDDGESGYGTGEDYMYDDDVDGDGESRNEDDDEEPEVTKDDELPAGKERPYVVLTEDVVRARQDADTAAVAEVLEIPSGFAAALLRHFKWKRDRAQEEWFSDDRRVCDAVSLLADGGVPVRTPLSSDRLICAICFDGYAARRTRSAGCSHYYCGDCWCGYVRAAVGDGARCLSLRCPDPACSAAVVGDLVDAVADDEDKARYARFALRSYVEESGGRIRWCPGPGCALAIEFTGSADDSPDNMAAMLDIEVTKLTFLTDAYKQIVDCRRVLRWAHAYGYYLDPERDMKKRDLFDELQKHASSWLERLHGCVEQERVKLCAGEGGAAMNEAYREYKQRVLDLTSATRPYFENLVRAFENDLPELNSET